MPWSEWTCVRLSYQTVISLSFVQSACKYNPVTASVWKSWVEALSSDSGMTKGQ